jgi:hypothetical protein
MKTQRIEIVVTCDHCPAGESQDVADTVTVGYGTAQYELDLCKPHKTGLNKTMIGIIGEARRSGRPASKSGVTKEEKQFRSDARAWAQKTGHHVNRTGIIPAATLAAYREYLRGEMT